MNVTGQLSESEIKVIFESCFRSFSYPSGRGQVTIRSPFRDEKKPSFSLHVPTGCWTDHATGQRGDAVTIVQLLNGTDARGAIEIVESIIGRKMNGNGNGSFTSPTARPATPLVKQTGTAVLAPAVPPAKKSEVIKKEFVETYRYTDESGNLLFCKDRFKVYYDDGTIGKDFSQYRIVDEKKVYQLGDVRRTLYRLPELTKAPMDRTVWVCAGEKDANRLESHGLLATTNFEGEGKWKDEYTESLKGRPVCILQDNDEAGRNHCRSVAGKLHTGCSWIKIVALPGLREKGDVSDWLDTGHTIEEFFQFVESVSVWDLERETVDSIDGSADKSIQTADDHPYLATDSGFFLKQFTKDGIIEKPLSNFTARIVSDVLHDDGEESRRYFEIEARLNGKISITDVPASQFFPMGWVGDALGASAFIVVGANAKDHVRAAIQKHSVIIRKGTIYSHTGWRELDGRMCYLHSKGAITADGDRTDVEVLLPKPLEPFDLSEVPTEPETQANALNRFFNLHPKACPILIGTIARAILGQSPFTVFLAGYTGVFKSEISSLAMRFFGAGFNADCLPGSFTSTGNFTESLAFTCKDALLIVDDLAPSGSASEVQRIQRDAGRILRAQGNHAGRGRMRSDASLRVSKTPRGTIVASGEDLPAGQSVRARCLIVEIKKGDIDSDMLTECQGDASAGVYQSIMRHYIQWIARRGVKETIAELHEISLDLRSKLQKDDRHKRTADQASQIIAASMLFLGFCQETGIMDGGTSLQYLEAVKRVINEVSGEQAGHQEDADPAKLFFRLLAAAVTSGSAHLAGISGGYPDNASAFGWTPKESGYGYLPLGTKIGWIDGDDVILCPDTSYRIAAEHGSKCGTPISISPRILIKRLHEGGYLSSTGSESDRTKVRRSIDGIRRRVIVTTKSIFYSENS